MYVNEYSASVEISTFVKLYLVILPIIAQCHCLTNMVVQTQMTAQNYVDHMPFHTYAH